MAERGADRQAGASAVLRAAAAPRIVIEQVSPVVDGGRFAAKTDEASPLVIAATVFCDGHEALVVRLLWRAPGRTRWQAVAMQPLGNDRWEARLPPAPVGEAAFAVEAWISPYDNLLHRLQARYEGGVDVRQEWEDLLRFLTTLATPGAPAALENLLGKLETEGAGDDPRRALRLLQSAPVRRLVARLAPRLHRVRSPRYRITVERLAARFASWYELFPRSATDDPGRHGTLRDVIDRLPAIRAMGFDVLYLPPIHPIGQTHRKGRNNSLTAAADDPGSPYAIGDARGGHEAIHAELGTLADFRALVRAARREGMELAMDFAIQCSPDHPWLRSHPQWFDWRADGTLRHAENPPKRYEDIVLPDFYQSGAIPGLWLALRDVLDTWVKRGVNIFRVDNPHTKPLPFWEWVIADLRARHPQLIFLSEAFTRPAMLTRLAKCGFSQSYTYFTWRNDKQSLTDFFTELSRPPMADYLRPNLFVNTPDINPYFLQHGGRAAFLIRAVLAATGSGLWGIYSGFEICEAAALPEREEYLDSEKYQIRVRDPYAPGHIREEITLLNRLRAAHPALQAQRGFSAYNAWNDNILYYGKATPDRRSLILVAVCLDPFEPQEADFELPLWEFGLADDATIEAEDLCEGRRFHWHGKRQWMRIDPARRPFMIWRLFHPAHGAEHDTA